MVEFILVSGVVAVFLYLWRLHQEIDEISEAIARIESWIESQGGDPKDGADG